MSNNRNIKFKKIAFKYLYKFLIYYLVACWVLIGFGAIKIFIEKRYVYPLTFKYEVFEYADYYGLDRALVFAVIKTESGFDKKAESSKGAKGLMQITDKTASYIADKIGAINYDIFDVDTNINFGCFYIKYLCNKFNDIKTAIVAYNAGEGNVALWLLSEKYSDNGKTLKEIPFSESKEYLRKVEQNFEKYKKLYMNILDKTKNIE